MHPNTPPTLSISHPKSIEFHQWEVHRLIQVISNLKLLLITRAKSLRVQFFSQSGFHNFLDLKMFTSLKKISVAIFTLIASTQVFAAPVPEIDGSLGLQVLALGAGLAFLIKRNKK